MEKILNKIIFSFKYTHHNEKFINKYDLLAMLLDTPLLKYEEQIIRLANDMRLINGEPYYKIYEKELTKNKDKKNDDYPFFNYQLISMTKDVPFYDFMDELRKMIYFTQNM